MPLHIQNDQLHVLFNEPGSIYKSCRFDWSSQLTQITWKKKYTFCGAESLDTSLDSTTGKGLFCEFGIDQPIGYDDCPLGEYFPKIGVGLLSKTSDEPYSFFYQYPFQPANFILNPIADNSMSFTCMMAEHRGHGFTLEKKYELNDASLLISYQLENTGHLPINTNEYCHNFISINQIPVNNTYRLIFSDIIHESMISEKVNPQEVVNFNKNQISWRSIPESDFFFSRLQGLNGPITSWSVENLSAGVGMKESCDFVPDHCNLWGKGHVVSPELFFNISLLPGKQTVWQRKYEFYKL